jgi:YacP-like NYN domain
VPYLLDGDNLVGSALGRRGSSGDRDPLVREISDRLRRTKARVVLFFDGAGHPLTLGSLSVRFSGGVSADDAIVREVSRSRRPHEAIVVTADRELARRARDAGAVAISPDDFWSRFAVEIRAPTVKDDPRIDAEEWIRWFSDASNRSKE